jgi:hypothetical protein
LAVTINKIRQNWSFQILWRFSNPFPVNSQSWIKSDAAFALFIVILSHLYSTTAVSLITENHGQILVERATVFLFSADSKTENASQR